MTKLFSGTFGSGVCFFVVILIVVAIIACIQLTVNPHNLQVPFSIIAGGEVKIDYPEDPCRNIELNSFTPSIPIVAVLTRASSKLVGKRIEQVLFNHSLQVGFDPNQLTYYGVPVSTDDHINLYFRASSISPDIQSVTVLVYDVVGFSQFLEYATNANPVYTYSLNRNCLFSVSGCTVNSIALLEGWMYFVFETTPSPSTLVVTLEATVREYDLSNNVYIDSCRLYGNSSSCFLEVPTREVKEEVSYGRDSTGTRTKTVYLPFTITYEASPLISNSTPSQSLNVSADLSWTCSRNDLNIYIIALAVGSGVLLIAIGFIVFVIFVGCFERVKSYVRKIRGKSDQNQNGSTKVELEAVMQSRSGAENQKPQVNTEFLPPAYDKLAKTGVGLPYYQ